jgi:CxxC motif-containing protein (DUF1111 family)
MPRSKEEQFDMRILSAKNHWVAQISCVAALAVGLGAGTASAQNPSGHSGSNSGGAAQVTDPGVRGGSPGAGGMLNNLTGDYQQFFTAALTRFQEIDSVSGTLANENGKGLGPRFNATSCSGCHAFPAIGGSSPFANPQIQMASADGAMNKIPRFIHADGPVREARFVRNPDGSPDGGVHDLFVITGRQDSGNCKISQPDFESALDQNNVIFRVPTPIFGAGLVESITDSAIVANASNHAAATVGISGQANRSGNDGTVTRFGWKAQNKSLLMFAGEAYNVEQGVTNELFPNERDETQGCVINALPEDGTNTASNGGYAPSDFASDLVNFAMFARLSAPPTPAVQTAATASGGQIFNQIGCNLCHTPSINPGSNSPYTNLPNPAVSAFSDFLVHHMGQGLADNVSQGLAAGDQFRTAPLWGVGQRVFFLHDGRTNDLVQAIEAHRSRGSEANQVINNFNSLSPRQAQSLLVFLRSL